MGVRGNLYSKLSIKILPPKGGGPSSLKPKTQELTCFFVHLGVASISLGQ